MERLTSHCVLFALQFWRARRCVKFDLLPHSRPMRHRNHVMPGVPAERWLAAVFCASGAAALIFEVVWFHRAGLVFGNDLWSTSLVLSTFMGGLALGNGLVVAYGRRRAARCSRRTRVIEVAVAVTGVAVTHLLPQLTRMLVAFSGLTAHPALFNGLRGLVAFAVLMIPTTCMGATLPVLVAALCRQQASFGYVLGRLYGWNTLGAVAGVLASETLLVPRLGIAGTAWFAGTLNICGAGAVLTIARRAAESRPSASNDQQPESPFCQLVGDGRAGISVPRWCGADGAGGDLVPVPLDVRAEHDADVQPDARGGAGGDRSRRSRGVGLVATATDGGRLPAVRGVWRRPPRPRRRTASSQLWVGPLRRFTGTRSSGLRAA